MSQSGTNSSKGGGGGSNVQTLTGNTGGAVPPTSNNINIIGSGALTVTGTPGTSTLTISTTSSSVWSSVSTNTAMAPGNGYFCVSPGGSLNMALPTTSNEGDTIELALDGATAFHITQAAGQSMVLGALTTTTGVGGSITSTVNGDAIKLVCRIPNTRWVTVSYIGNLAVV